MKTNSRGVAAMEEKPNAPLACSTMSAARRELIKALAMQAARDEWARIAKRDSSHAVKANG